MMNPMITDIAEKQGMKALDDAIEAEFKRLADAWESETRHLTSIEKMSMSWDYQRIIGLGAAALPYIFRRLERKGGHWFWALSAITGVEMEIPEIDAPRAVELMTHYWLKWARDHEWL